MSVHEKGSRIQGKMITFSTLVSILALFSIVKSSSNWTGSTSKFTTIVLSCSR